MPETAPTDPRTRYSGAVLSADPVPLVDLAFQHAAVATEVAEALLAVMDGGPPAQRQAVTRLEAVLAAFCRRRHCVCVANGVDTFSLMLRAAGIGRGDEVILPANGRLATVAAVMRTGAWPILADCDPEHHLLQPDDVCRRLTPRTKAVLALHLFGQMAPIEDIAAILGDRPVILFEDAAQCLGATRHGKLPGACSSAVATSFHPGMSLGAFGGGGAVLTDDGLFAARARSMNEHGNATDPERYRPGPPAHFDIAEAVVLSAKVHHVRAWNQLRNDAARLYGEWLGSHERITLPAVLPANDHVWHRYVVRIPGRDAVLAALQSAGIGAAVHYAVPLHLLPAAEMLGYRRGAFPNAEAAADQMLSLPMYPGIRPDQIERVCRSLRRALRR